MDPIEETERVADEMAARREAIAGLRELASFLEQHPEFQLPYELDHGSFSVFLTDPSTLAAHVRTLGRGEKFSAEWGTGVKVFFGPLEMTVSATRAAVCERRVVGTKAVQKPDPEYVAAAPMVDAVEEIVEWVCPESFLALDARP